MTDQSPQEHDLLIKPPEQVSDADFIAWMKGRWAGMTRLPDFPDYDETPARLLTNSFTNAYVDMEKTEAGKLRKTTEKYPLVDLGGGLTGLPDAVLQTLGIKTYIDVDLQVYPHESFGKKFVQSDMLEYLLTLPDGYGNVMSNGVLNRDWFTVDMGFGGWSPEQKKSMALQKEYLKRLFQQVARVLPKDGVFLVSNFGFTNIAQEQGLQLVRGGRPVVLQKAQPSQF